MLKHYLHHIYLLDGLTMSTFGQMTIQIQAKGALQLPLVNQISQIRRLQQVPLQTHPVTLMVRLGNPTVVSHCTL